MTPVRDAYKAMTRERILDAAIELMAKTGAEPVTIAAVAAGAGVTHRTVYRHFKTRDDLIEAVWPRLQQRVLSKGFPRTADDLVATPGRLFPRFDENAQLVRASAFSEAGLEVRLRSNAERQEAMLACVADALPGMEPQAMRRRAAVAQLIDSAYAWAALRDFWGLDGVEAGRAAGEALAVLLGRRGPSDDAPFPIEEERSET
ncbi:TetR family transcriptional regulator [Methylosinus sp. sav-2]|uniref:TetR/AcrR family transcriptional regulator n=1 Tax=unclassified Methylosinus TaxID=2624500 RepID=UPI0004ADCD73|nr:MULTISPECIES: TetR/AcrR family transcriptional regulator [unclassified Methylosinus]TDX67223.1 TetR family transcriptional regulator [Methylosinus sp. sav-2]